MLFETKDYTIKAEKKEGCLLIVNISASKEYTQNIYKKAIKVINKEISVPGFRKGKVPDDTVIKKFGPQIDQEWKELIINDLLNATFTHTKIYPLTKKSLHKPKIEKCSLQEGAELSFSYEHYPIIAPIDFSSFEAPPFKIEPVSEQEIQDVLEEIVESHATWNEISDRPVAEGDYVDLTLEALEGETTRPIANRRRFHVAPKKMGSWMRTLIIGKNVSDVVEGESSPDEEASFEIREKFKKTLVRITIHGLFQADLPPLDEEFVKKLGAPSLDALRERIISDLQNEEREKQEEKRYEHLKEWLLEKYPLDLPSTLLQEERKERIERKIRDLRKQNLSEEEVKSKVQEAEPSITQESQRAIQLFFLKKRIINQGNIEVTDSELNLFSKNFYNKSVKELPENVLDNLSHSLLERKIKEYALSQVPT